MDINEARDLAHEIMAEYLPTGRFGWSFEFDQAKRRFGLCSYRRQTISLSEPLVRLNERARVENTIRHEVAHAIAGAGAGHGRVWIQACYVTGADPKRCYDSANTETPVAPWRAECPNGHFSIPRHRRGANRVCAKCRAHVVYVRNTDIGSN